uniref:Calpain catalytic domain-containing protein n=1 Tax=Myripristis murdjan TaxID=586833 RepID=A0A667XDW6_9TELE
MSLSVYRNWEKVILALLLMGLQGLTSVKEKLVTLNFIFNPSKPITFNPHYNLVIQSVLHCSLIAQVGNSAQIFFYSVNIGRMPSLKHKTNYLPSSCLPSGNCWLLASFGSLTLRKSLMAQVVPSDQNFKDGYAGIFHFRFWRFGKWVDVVVDDLLPTRNFLPVSVSSKSGTEFWAPLMEKAYAKVCGSYGDMIAGNPSEAFMDFSGRVHMNYKLTKQPSDLWDVMTRATQAKTMMGCATYGQKGKPGEEAGLVSGHAYAVTGVKQVLSEGMEVNLVRIWNPWGRKEWNGDWSDKSELWETVSSDVRDQCLKVRNDGEFWMTLEDYCVYYEDMDICCDSPNFLDDDAACQWKCSMKEGCWEAGESDVGSDCHKDKTSFWKNPQFRIRVKAVEGESQGSKNILVSLMQKSDEEKRSKVEYHAIGFMIYEVPPEVIEILTASLMGDSSPLEVSTFCFAREIVELHSLQPGEYVIIPCTSEPEKTSSFILTIYSKAEADRRTELQNPEEQHAPTEVQS